ncbi:MAG: hypothetical protein ABIP22_09525 [Ginsengibacter sp.]
MTLQKFITRLNWRQVLIHFIATWFFMYSFRALAVLHDTNLADIFRHTGSNNLQKNLNENKISASDFSDFVVWISVGNTVGIFTAFIISLTISIKRKWFWFNSFLVFVLVNILSWLNLSGWNYLKKIFLTPGEIFNNTTLEFLTTGLILLILGLLTFFLPTTNKFIVISKRKTTKPLLIKHEFNE